MIACCPRANAGWGRSDGCPERGFVHELGLLAILGSDRVEVRFAVRVVGPDARGKLRPRNHKLAPAAVAKEVLTHVDLLRLK